MWWARATQYVIANVGFLGLPLLLNLFHPAAPRGGISWGFGDDGLLTNICITTVRNLIRRHAVRGVAVLDYRPAATAPDPGGTNTAGVFTDCLRMHRGWA